MDDSDRTKGQLIEELAKLRERVSELETGLSSTGETLQQCEEQLQNISTLAFVGTAMYLNGHIMEVNQAFADMFGYEPAEMIGMKALDLADPDSRELILENIRVGSVKPYQVKGVRKDDTRFWAELVVKECRYQGQKVRVAALRDITKYKEIESELLVSQRNWEVLFDSAEDFLFILDMEGHILRVNSTVLKRLGYSEEHLLGASVLAVHPPPRHEEAMSIIADMLVGKLDSCPVPLQAADGTLIPVETKVAIGKWDDRDVLLGLSRDISEREQAEKQLIAEKAFSEAIIDNLPGILYLVDGNGKLIRWNKNLEELIGESASEIAQSANLHYIADEDRQHTTGKFQEVFETGRTEAEAHIVNRDGQKVPFYFTGHLISMDGEPHVLGMAIDISERKRAEGLIQLQRELGLALLAAPKLDETLRICLDTALSASGMDGGGIYLVDETTGIDLICHTGLSADFVRRVQHYDYDTDSRNVQMLLGRKPIYLDADQLAVPIIDALSAANVRSLAVIPVLFEDRVIACFNLASHTHSAVPDFARSTLEAIATQIGTAISRSKIEEALRQAHNELELRVEERTRELRESEARWRSLVENAPDAILTADANGTIQTLNRTLGRIPIENVLGSSVFRYTSPEYQEIFRELFDMAFKEGVPGSFEGPGTGANRDIWFSIRMGPIKQGGQVMAVTLLISDITSRKRIEESIRTSLIEKEALLKEIHHRVKNNLQIIASLLNLQARYTEDKQAIEQIMESRNRIYSMALVHENLYRSATLAWVSMDSYVSDLVNTVAQSYGVELNRIKLHMNIADISLNIDQAIPCGLIINELLSNALKHAFPDVTDKQKPVEKTVRIDLHTTEDSMLSLSVADNGVGLPEDIDINSSRTLGLRLVRSLAQQLDASLEVDTSPSTTFRILFQGNAVAQEGQ